MHCDQAYVAKALTIKTCNSFNQKVLLPQNKIRNCRNAPPHPCLERRHLVQKDSICCLYIHAELLVSCQMCAQLFAYLLMLSLFTLHCVKCAPHPRLGFLNLTVCVVTSGSRGSRKAKRCTVYRTNGWKRYVGSCSDPPEKRYVIKKKARLTS